jgi:hypothetical protein
MDGLTRDGAAWRPDLIVIECSLVTPAGSEAVLRQMGLLTEFNKVLVKTAEEEKSIAAAFDALNEVRRELGLDAARLDAGHIHVVDECEFWQRYGNSRRAFTEFGHVFLPRRYLLLNFLQDLTHEIVHLSSLRAVVDPMRPKDETVRYMRSGFSPLDGRALTQRWRFSGFNEGVTELLAVEVRKRLVAKTVLLNETMAEVLVKDLSYRVQVRLVGELIGLAGGSDEAAARRTVFLDYFNRSPVFLKKLARARSGAVCLLSMMSTDAETLDVAEKLGFEEAAAAIRRYMCRRRRR